MCELNLYEQGNVSVWTVACCCCDGLTVSLHTHWLLFVMRKAMCPVSTKCTSTSRVFNDVIRGVKHVEKADSEACVLPPACWVLAKVSRIQTDINSARLAAPFKRTAGHFEGSRKEKTGGKKKNQTPVIQTWQTWSDTTRLLHSLYAYASGDGKQIKRLMSPTPKSTPHLPLALFYSHSL